MHEQLHTTIDYNKLIEMQAKEVSYPTNVGKNTSKKNKPEGSKVKVKTLGSRKRG